MCLFFKIGFISYNAGRQSRKKSSCYLSTPDGNFFVITVISQYIPQPISIRVKDRFIPIWNGMVPLDARFFYSFLHRISYWSVPYIVHDLVPTISSCRLDEMERMESRLVNFPYRACVKPSDQQLLQRPRILQSFNRVRLFCTDTFSSPNLYFWCRNPSFMHFIKFTSNIADINSFSAKMAAPVAKFFPRM